MTKRRINVRAVIWHGGKLLAAKQKESDGSETKYWCIPGGGLDPHESLQDGCAREVMEETGIEAKVGKLLFIQQFSSHREGYDEELEFFFAIENPEDFQHIDLAKTTHGMDEISRIEFIDPATSYIQPSFFAKLSLADYFVDDKPVYFHNVLGK